MQVKFETDRDGRILHRTGQAEHLVTTASSRNGVACKTAGRLKDKLIAVSGVVMNRNMSTIFRGEGQAKAFLCPQTVVEVCIDAFC